MQIIHYTRSDLRQYCPTTGQALLDGLDPSAPTVRGVWFEEVVDEPCIPDAELQSAWDKYVADREEAGEEFLDADEFLGKFEHKGWVVFALTNDESDIEACGWVVVDLEMRT